MNQDNCVDCGSTEVALHLNITDLTGELLEQSQYCLPCASKYGNDELQSAARILYRRQELMKGS